MNTNIASITDNVNYFFASDESAAPLSEKIIKNPARMKLARQKIEGIELFTIVRADNFQLVASL